MFRFTIRDVVAVVAAGFVVTIFAVVGVGVLWWLNGDSKVGRIRRGLEHVDAEMEQRDKEIDALIGTGDK